MTLATVLAATDDDPASMPWSETVFVLGVLAILLVFVLGGAATFLESRKLRRGAQHEDELRALVSRYEQLAASTLDAQQRTATDVAELRARTTSVEQLLRTVE